MKKFTNIALFLLIGIVHYSCQNSDGKNKYQIDTSEFRTETVNDFFSVEVPGDMKKTTSLNPDASLQLENIYEEKYLAILNEDKESFVKNFKISGQYSDSLSVVGNYRAIQMDAFTSGMTFKRRGTPNALKINDMPAEQVEIEAFPAGMNIDIYYLITFIEGKDQLYMFLEWTLGSKKDEHQNTFKYMAETLEEL